MTKHNTHLLLFILCTLLTYTPLSAKASFVAPGTVMIEDRQRAAVVTIINTTDKAKVYSFEWQERAQLPDGKIVELQPGDTPPPGHRSAQSHIILSPRQVVIQPNKSQRVRLFVRRPADLQEGEYRSHLLIKPEDLEEAEREVIKDQGFGSAVKFKAYISIPVFLRHGETMLDFDAENIRLSKHDKNNWDKLEFTLLNKGTRSMYASAIMECTPTGGGAMEQIPMGQQRVYQEAKTVPFRGLAIKKGVRPLEECESLELVITAAKDFEYRGKDAIKRYKIR